MLAFVDENLSDNEAKALQSKLEKIPGAADCTFVSRQEARDSYVEQYDEDDLYLSLIHICHCSPKAMTAPIRPMSRPS